MKKAVIIFIVAALVIATTIIWILSSGNLQLVDIANFGIIFLLVALAVLLGYRRLSSARRGEPAEDELSKKVMRKASSLAYYISLYLWLLIMLLSDKLNYETHTIIGMGILGMAVVFAVCWLIVNFTGVRNE
jgi:peptidoglycan/LPS O-acetylase OafA/YrhL